MLPIRTLSAVAALPLLLTFVPAEAGHICGVPSQAVHTYSFFVGASTTSPGPESDWRPSGGGDPVVYDSDSEFCDADGDGFARDFSGDYDVGFGLGFFGLSTAENALRNDACQYGLHLHAGPSIVVADSFFASPSAWLGAEGMDGFPLLGDVACPFNLGGPVAGPVGYGRADPASEIRQQVVPSDGLIGDDPNDCLIHFRTRISAFACEPITGGNNEHPGVWVFLDLYTNAEELPGDQPEMGFTTTGTIAIG